MKKIISKIISYLHSLEIEEHTKISQIDHIQQVTTFLNTFHKHLRNYELLVDINDFYQVNKYNLIANNNEQNTIKLLGDYEAHNNSYTLEELYNNSDLFKVQKSKSKVINHNYKSIYEINPFIKKNIYNEIGFYLKEKQSVINNTHMSSVFIKVKNDIGFVTEGTFLGFYGGKCSADPFDDEITTDKFSFIRRPNNRYYTNKIKIRYPQNFITQSSTVVKEYVSPDLINFYSLAHKVRHCPNNKRPNVVLIDIEIPLEYLPNIYYKYIPYEYDSDDEMKRINMLGLFSLEKLNNNDELFLDYYDSLVINYDDFDKIPNWLVMHKNYNNYLIKKQYENELPEILKYFKTAMIPSKILEKEDLFSLLEGDLEMLKEHESYLNSEKESIIKKIN